MVRRLRGQPQTERLHLTVPASWNVTTPLPAYQLALQYNDANQVTTTQTSTLHPTVSGLTTSQVYDSTTGVLTGLSNNLTAIANLASLSFNSNALVSDLTFFTSNGPSSTLADEHLSYDGDLRPVETTATWRGGSGSSGQLFDQSRWYDPASNVSSLATTFGAVNSPTSEVQNFCYDEQSRLVWVGNSGSQPGAGNGTCGTQSLSHGLSGASYNNSFVSTHLGQLWQGPLGGSSTSSQYLYCTSAPHQLSGLYSSGATCANKSGQVYKSSTDAWGNVTSRTYQGTSTTLAYDALDHLVKWSGGSGNNEFYVYDASGTRVLRRATNGGTTTLTTYPFGIEDHTYSGDGTLQSNTYYYSLAGRLIGELTGSPTPTQTNLFLTDALGSVVDTFSNIAGSAAVLGSQVYGPYGTQRYQQGSMGTTKGFTGQYADATGLDYYNARYYDPVVGMFLSADTVQGNLQGMNPYGYVGGNPETRSDPTGHRQCGPDSCNSGGYDNGGGNPTPPPPPPPPFQPTNTCTQNSCSVTVEGQTYSLNQLKTSVTDRVQFLQCLYDQFASGYGNSEIAFVNYLIGSGRLSLSAYWNSVDFQVMRDQLLAAYDFLHHVAGQSSLVNNWLTFFAHPSTNGWWAAHNDSINAGDQQARTDGVYAKKSVIEQ